MTTESCEKRSNNILSYECMTVSTNGATENAGLESTGAYM